MEPFDAAMTAVYLHGIAGDIAAEMLTQEAMIATDIIKPCPTPSASCSLTDYALSMLAG